MVSIRRKCALDRLVDAWDALDNDQKTHFMTWNSTLYFATAVAVRTHEVDRAAKRGWRLWQRN